jgi:serine/threonine protein kinase
LNNVKDEIETLKKAQHKNIINFKEAYMTQANIHLVFEYFPHPILLNYISNNNCNSPTLLIKRENNKKLNEDTVRKIFVQLLEVLFYLKKENIVHRDIKLDNIIINPNNLLLKVIDFGFGKIFKQNEFSDKMDLICGTLEYMAPEILFKNGMS